MKGANSFTFMMHGKLAYLAMEVIMCLVLNIIAASFSYAVVYSVQKRQVMLTAVLEDQGDPKRWNLLFVPAMQELRKRHPDINIQLNYTTFPYSEARSEMLKALSNQTPIDLVSLDQIWLGEFARNGLLTDLTNLTQVWGRTSEWYQANWDGGIYEGGVYGIWAWTDVRGIWYWKDLLLEAGVNPDSLKTWGGYITAAKKLNTVLRPQGIEGIHLTGATHSPDLWYPYLWIMGGEIIKMKPGHPTKGTYWFPAYNSTEGTKALEFLKLQVDAGIKPQKVHFWGIEFLDKKFAVMIEALQHHIREKFPINSSQMKHQFEERVGFIPMFPIPDASYHTSSLMGGWEFAIPKTSMHTDLSWELITILVEPKILAPYLAAHSNLPTQIPIGEGPYARDLNATTPYYDDLINMLKAARNRPSIPEYPEISENIRQAIEQIYNGTMEPKQALDGAAAKSAKVLGW
jgi:multiple sugar transport system substrate-binding protein